MRAIRRVLVTGGLGFLGSWVVEALLQRGVEVVILDRTARQAAPLAAGVEVVRAEIADADLVGLAREVDAVFHLAGTPVVPASVEHPLEDLRTNTEATLMVLEAVRSLRRAPLVAFVSSAAVYGESVRLPMGEDHPLAPVSPYGVSKLASEQYVRLYARMYGISTFSVRPFSLYGPRQRKLVVYDLLVRLFDGEERLTVLGSPDVSRDFVFAEDAARMLVQLAWAAPAHGEVYNVASGCPLTLGELTRTLNDVAGTNALVEFTGTVRPGDPIHWHGDPGRAKTLGAICTTQIRDGLEQTVSWFASARHAVRA